MAPDDHLTAERIEATASALETLAIGGHYTDASIVGAVLALETLARTDPDPDLDGVTADLKQHLGGGQVDRARYLQFALSLRVRHLWNATTSEDH